MRALAIGVPIQNNSVKYSGWGVHLVGAKYRGLSELLMSSAKEAESSKNNGRNPVNGDQNCQYI